LEAKRLRLEETFYEDESNSISQMLKKSGCHFSFPIRQNSLRNETVHRDETQRAF